MKSKRGCLDILLRPISPTGPLSAFSVGYYGVFRVFANLVGERGWPQTLSARTALAASAFLLANFASMILWRLVSRLLGEGFGEVDEPALSKPASRLIWILGILGMIALAIAMVLIHSEPPPKPPPFTSAILFP